MPLDRQHFLFLYQEPGLRVRFRSGIGVQRPGVPGEGGGVRFVQQEKARDTKRGRRIRRTGGQARVSKVSQRANSASRAQYSEVLPGVAERVMPRNEARVLRLALHAGQPANETR